VYATPALDLQAAGQNSIASPGSARDNRESDE
jgi:hypothetical protein